MRGADLDRRVSLQRQRMVDNGYGLQPVDEWDVIFARLPAQVQDTLPSKSEQVRNGARVADRTARVRMRFMRGVDSAMRVIVHNDIDEVYQISSPPVEIGRREWIEFIITEYTTHGDA